jgi:hypothetical protein
LGDRQYIPNGRSWAIEFLVGRNQAASLLGKSTRQRGSVVVRIVTGGAMSAEWRVIHLRLSMDFNWTTHDVVVVFVTFL